MSTKSDPQNVRSLLADIDNNLQNLRAAVSRISSENMDETCGLLADRINKLEETERQLWATIFEAEPLDHRMTMFRETYTEQYY